MGSQGVKVSFIVAFALVGAGVSGCANNATPASVSAIGRQAANAGSAPDEKKLTDKPSITATTTKKPETTLPMQNGHIIYNRSYNQIDKGSYNGKRYKVKRGDTLFFIAWITGNDFRDLARRNHITAPYSLTAGQILLVKNESGSPITERNAITAADAFAGKRSTVSGPVEIKPSTVAQQPLITYSGGAGKSSGGEMLPPSGATVATTTAPITAPTVSSMNNSTTLTGTWLWPTAGKTIENFSASEGGNKGIDIAGSRSQPVMSTASGRVVYAGNALRGYGNLIIIKHNDDYLSAYAHNETMLVRDQQQVKAGQKIATMGSSGTSSVRLHFEIRYKGKSVNPLRYLSQR